MKYMTKDWYETMQKTYLHLLLKVTKKAEVYSEDYFKELYKREEKKMLKIQTFDSERERKNFRQAFRNNIKVLKEKLPEEIIDKVADIRVLALNYASAEVKKDITSFCKQNEKNVRSASDAYQRQYRKQFKTKAPAFAKELNLHDCEVRSCRRIGNDVVITLYNGGGFTNITRIRMKNCEVITQDSALHGARCLYEEIYKTGEKYEIHFLMEKNKLIDYIVSVDDLEYQYE